MEENSDAPISFLHRTTSEAQKKGSDSDLSPRKLGDVRINVNKLNCLGTNKHGDRDGGIALLRPLIAWPSILQ